MNRSEPSMPRGTTFVRSIIARTITDSPLDSLNLAAVRWGHDSLAYVTTKAGVGATDHDRDLIRAGEMQQEFVEAVQQVTAMDRLALRRVPGNVPTTNITTRAQAFWRGQAKAAKVSAQALDRSTLTSLSLGALIVVSNDLLRDSSPEAEALLTRDLVQALAVASDASFFDASNSGTTGVEPAAVTSGAATVASTGDLVTDLQLAFAEFSGQWSTAAWACNPRLAADIGLLYGGKGVGADVGARGGTLAGLPLFVTEGLAADSSGTGDLVLVDGGSVLLVDEGASVDRSDVTTLEMDGDPAQDAFAPTGPTGAFVSLWQADCTALLATRRVNWRLARAGGCVTITDCAYAPAS